MEDFVALDFETTGYEGGGSNEPWQLGIAVVRGGEVVETREFFFDAEGAPARAHEADALGTLQGLAACRAQHCMRADHPHESRAAYAVGAVDGHAASGEGALSAPSGLLARRTLRDVRHCARD